MCSRPTTFMRRHRSGASGFTLIELMVTVVIIGLLATLAVPGIMHRVNHYRAKSAAESIANTVRLARLRAMGRGGAVRVNLTANLLSVTEGIMGDAAAEGCTTLPEPGCNRAWDATDSQLVESFDHTAGGDYTTEITQGATTATSVSLCFPPSGRALVLVGASYKPLSQVVRVGVEAVTGGLSRDVLLLPNGTARVRARVE